MEPLLIRNNLMPFGLIALVLAATGACGSEPSNTGGAAGAMAAGSSAGGAGANRGGAPSGTGGANLGPAGSSAGTGTAGVPSNGGAGGGGSPGGAGTGANGGAAAGGSAGVGVGGSAASGAAGSAGNAASGSAGMGGAVSGAGGAAGHGGAGIQGGAGGGGAGPKLGTLACGKAWSNPAKGDSWAHDPSLTREGDVYYLFSTGRPTTGSVPRDMVTIKSSTDGVTWARRGSAFPSVLPWWRSDIPAPEIWAGEVRKVKDTYYLYYSISAWGNYNSSIGLATNTTLDSTNPAYNWVDRGKVIDFRNGGTGVNVIDPNLFIEDDGTWWLVYGSYRSGLRLTQLDPATGKLLKDPPDITTLTNSLGEGVSLLKRGTYYYLIVSTGTCCALLDSTYHVGMGRAATLKGPFITQDNRRMLDGAYTTLLRGDANHPGVGGQSFYEENGQLYMVYHAYTRPSGEAVINVRPIFFSQAGWPTMDPCMAAP
ncbi:MAG TPA: arabinan endo-1,5-alpha-L-arabinosidase [Polyangiaceae bacterium]|nr:arabinan endo-1,5-alpha-L-arabinosidase [Polyangiaceae bacterium]